MDDDKAYYSIYMKHKEKGYEIKHDIFELKIDDMGYLMKEIMKLVPKGMRRDEWSMQIDRLD